MTANKPLRADERIGTTSCAQTATDIEFVLSRIASGAAEHDAHPSFPEGTFDLIVVSEILYYWPREVVLEALRRFEGILVPGGVLVAVHWRKETKTYPLQGDEVHELLVGHTRLKNTKTAKEPEYWLDVFENSP